MKKKTKDVKFDDLVLWVENHDARIVQAGQYPAQVVYLLEDDLPGFCDAHGLKCCGPVTGGQCYSLEGDDCYAVAMVFKMGTGQEVGTIAHECYHAVNFIYKKYGARHSLGNDEPAAYLMSHLAFYAAKFLEEHGYGFTRLDDQSAGRDEQDSGDLRQELPGAGQERQLPGAEPEGCDSDSASGPGAKVLPCGCAGRCAGHHSDTALSTKVNVDPRTIATITALGPDAYKCDACGVMFKPGERHNCRVFGVRL